MHRTFAVFSLQNVAKMFLVKIHAVNRLCHQHIVAVIQADNRIFARMIRRSRHIPAVGKSPRFRKPHLRNAVVAAAQHSAETFAIAAEIPSVRIDENRMFAFVQKFRLSVKQHPPFSAHCRYIAARRFFAISTDVLRGFSAVGIKQHARFVEQCRRIHAVGKNLIPVISRLHQFPVGAIQFRMFPGQNRKHLARFQFQQSVRTFVHRTGRRVINGGFVCKCQHIIVRCIKLIRDNAFRQFGSGTVKQNQAAAVLFLCQVIRPVRQNRRGKIAACRQTHIRTVKRLDAADKGFNPPVRVKLNFPFRVHQPFAVCRKKRRNFPFSQQIRVPCRLSRIKIFGCKPPTAVIQTGTPVCKNTAVPPVGKTDIRRNAVGNLFAGHHIVECLWLFTKNSFHLKKFLGLRK